MGVGHLFSSFQKSWKLRKISVKLSKCSLEEESNNLDALIQLCLADKYLSIYLNDSGVTENTLKEIYHKLTKSGSGQFADGHYVAASSLVYGQTLIFLLDHYIDGKFYVQDFNEVDSSILISTRLVKYFENKETGEV